ARKYTLKEREKPPLEKAKTLSMVKLTSVKDYLDSHLDKIISNFPSLDNLEEFYIQLIRHTFDEKRLKQSLSTIGGLKRQVAIMTSKHRQLVAKAQNARAIDSHMTSYYGRIGSLFKRSAQAFHNLHVARDVIKTYPRLKKHCFTVCIAGFPNVGKSTLLSRLTTSTPEINSYAFTTKSLNVGYRKEQGISIQFIDTPGTLNREDKMNAVEYQAQLAMRYAAEAIIYVFDLTEESYPLKDQNKLFKQLKRLHMPMIAYLSKTDILEKEVIDEFTQTFSNKKIPVFDSKIPLLTALHGMYKELVR
ncbi:MAG: GTPase, partial [Nanoarchaeota archaeon]